MRSGSRLAGPVNKHRTAIHERPPLQGNASNSAARAAALSKVETERSSLAAAIGQVIAFGHQGWIIARAN